MPSLGASSSNQSGELRGPSTLWEELANQVLWIVLPSGSPRAPGIPFTKLGAAWFSEHLHRSTIEHATAHKRNTPSAGCFENHGTSSGDLGSPIFVEDGPLTTCASSPLASGQILSLAARDTGAHPVQKHAFGGSFRQIRHLFRRLCRTTRALCNLHSLAAREWPNTLTRCSRFGCVFFADTAKCR